MTLRLMSESLGEYVCGRGFEAEFITYSGETDENSGEGSEGGGGDRSFEQSRGYHPMKREVRDVQNSKQC